MKSIRVWSVISSPDFHKLYVWLICQHVKCDCRLWNVLLFYCVFGTFSYYYYICFKRYNFIKLLQTVCWGRSVVWWWWMMYQNIQVNPWNALYAFRQYYFFSTILFFYFASIWPTELIFEFNLYSYYLVLSVYRTYDNWIEIVTSTVLTHTHTDTHTHTYIQKNLLAMKSVERYDFHASDNFC